MPRRPHVESAQLYDPGGHVRLVRAHPAVGRGPVVARVFLGQALEQSETVMRQPSDREELVLLLREVMRWEKRWTAKLRPITCDAAWDDVSDILNRAHVAISTDTSKRVRQRPQPRC